MYWKSNYTSILNAEFCVTFEHPPPREMLARYQFKLKYKINGITLLSSPKKNSNGRKSNKENEVKKKWNEYCARSVLVQRSSKIGESWDGNAMSGKKTPKEHQITKICKQTSKCNQSEQCLSSIGIVEVCKVWQTHWAKIIEKERHQKDLHTKWYKQISLYANEVDILFLSSPYCLNGMLFCCCLTLAGDSIEPNEM